MRFKFSVKNDNVRSRPPNMQYEQTLYERVSFVKSVMDMASEEDKVFAASVDKEILYEFISKLSEPPSNKIMYWLRQIEQELIYVVIREKMRWHETRPYVCARDVGVDIPIPTNANASGVGPGYPSGHATISRFFANVFGLMYPEQWAYFFDVSNRICWSRLQLGVHFLRDIEEGRYLGDKFFENAKEAFGGSEKLGKFLRS